MKFIRKLTPLRIVVALSALLVVAGAGLLFAIWQSQAVNNIIVPPSAAATSAVAPKQTGPNVISGNPVNLQIPSLSMNLQIIPGVYNPRTQTWTLTLDKVQYATVTPEPNNIEGDTFLYGHYRPEVFAYLHHIKSGAQAIVTTDNGHVFTYQLASIQVVDPTDSAAVFNYKGKPILTIQTCTGLLFHERQLFTFDLVKVA
jgi:LPXTG-site transpeptidase (sortase) family protein